MDEKQINIDRFFKKLLKEDGLTEAPASFTADVLGQISFEEEISSQYQPVISKKAWYFIAASLLFVFVFVLLSEPTAKSENFLQPFFAMLDSMYNQVSGMFDFKGKWPSISPMLLMILLSVISLLFFDGLIRKYIRSK